MIIKYKKSDNLLYGTDGEICLFHTVTRYLFKHNSLLYGTI